MRLYQHDSYAEYVQAQCFKYDKKKSKIWALNTILEFIAQFIKYNCASDSITGICHGVRTGWEVCQIRKFLKSSKIFGTEISPKALNNSYVICWDFHKVKDTWLDSFDFIYSNSLDHSYDPRKCIDAWMSCLKPNGFCFIEWSSVHNGKLDAADCFRASSEEYWNMFEENYRVKEIFELDFSKLNRKIFIIHK